MTVQRNPSYDLSAIAMCEMLAQQFYQDERVNQTVSFVGGSEAPSRSTQPTIGRIDASYTVLGAVAGNLRSAAGIPAGLATPLYNTVETITSIEKRLRAVLDVLGRLQH